MLEPLIIGHRGASAVAPENTLIAFERAMAAGADGVEFDVQLARDGVPVVIHDATLKRTGLRHDAVSELSSLELGRIDVGSWFNLRFAAQARAEYVDATVPTLKQTLELLKDSNALLYIEMKCAASQSRSLAQEVASLIKQCRVRDRVVVASFLLDAIREIKEIDRAVRTGALFALKLTGPFPSKRAMVDRAVRYEADEALWHRSLARAGTIEEARRSGLKSVVWTVDHPSWIGRAKKYGIHAIITNDPERMFRERAQSNSVRTNLDPKASLS